MAVGLFGLVAVPVVVLHQVYLGAGAPAGERDRPVVARLGWATRASRAGARGGGRGAGDGRPLARLDDPPPRGRASSPPCSRRSTPSPADRPGLLARLIDLAPEALVLGLFAAVRSIRQALTDESDDRSVVGGALWVLWLAVAALVPAFWPRGPWHLFVAVPARAAQPAGGAGGLRPGRAAGPGADPDLAGPGDRADGRLVGTARASAGWSSTSSTAAPTRPRR